MVLSKKRRYAKRALTTVQYCAIYIYIYLSWVTPHIFIFCFQGSRHSSSAIVLQAFWKYFKCLLWKLFTFSFIFSPVFVPFFLFSCVNSRPLCKEAILNSNFRLFGASRLLHEHIIRSKFFLSKSTKKCQKTQNPTG